MAEIGLFGQPLYYWKISIFFLVGIIETSKESIQVFKDIIKLKEEIEAIKIPKLGSKTENGQKLLMYLFQTPITDITGVTKLLGIAPSTTNRLINEFIKLNILAEITGYKRNRKFIFRRYFELFQGKREE